MHFVELQLIYNVVLVSDIQQNDSVIYIYVYTYIYPFSYSFPLWFITRYWIQFTAMQ